MKRKLLKKKMFNLVLALVFVLTAMLSLLPPDVTLADSIDLKPTYKRKVSIGESFDFTLELTNNSSDVLVVNSIIFSRQSAAIPKDNDFTIVLNERVDPKDTVVILDTELRFIGDENNSDIELTINYTFDGKNNSTSTKGVSYPISVEKDDTDYTPPFDSTKYKPGIDASVADNVTVVAGQYTALDVTLKNTSSTTYARNIIFTPIYESGSPFTHVKTLSDMPIKEIRVKGSEVLRLSVNTSKFANPGMYPFKFKLTYTNPWGDEFSSEHTVYINVTNVNTNARLTVRTSSADNVSAVAGKSVSVPVYVMNTGDFYARDVLITVQGLSQDTFTLSSGTNRINFDYISGGDYKKFNLNLNASQKLQTGSYPLSFKVEYTKESGEKISEEQEIWIPVAGSGDAVSLLEISDLKTSKATVSSSDIFDVSLTVRNTGTANAEQIKVSADGSGSLLPVTQNLFIISRLAPGESRNLTFRFQPSPDAQRGSVPVVIKVESVDGSGNNSSISQAVSVFVEADGGSSDPNKNVPKIIVGSYSHEPQQVKAGEQFTLNMTFVNTHTAKTIRNIKGNFNVEEKSNETGNVFTPVDSSNTFYIDEIKPRGSHDWTVNLYTIPDAQSKTYTVTISFEYEDEQGNPYTAQEIIGIPVYQPSRFEISDISTPTEMYLGEQAYINFSLYNMGKTDLYNVKLRVEGDFAADPMSTYFGNFTPGYSEWCEIGITPMQPGVSKGKIVVEYETIGGELMTCEKEFALNVLEMPSYDPGIPVDGPFEPGMEEKSGGFIGSVWFYVIIGVAVAAAVVVTVIVVRKRRRSKEFEV